MARRRNRVDATGRHAAELARAEQSPVTESTEPTEPTGPTGFD